MSVKNVKRAGLFKLVIESIDWEQKNSESYLIHDGGAAAILGLHPSTLRARMHKLGIVRPEIKQQE